MRWIVGLLLAGCAAHRQAPATVRPAEPPPQIAITAPPEGEPSTASDPAPPNPTAQSHYPRTDSGLVWSRLPTPHRGSPTPLPAVDSPEQAISRVGHRDPRPPLAVALALASQLSHTAPIAADSPTAIVDWAQTHDAWIAVPAIAAGDLLIFDRAVAGERASLVAVATGHDDRGVVSFLYAAGGVIRRGHFDVSRPRTARDRQARVVNTYLRHSGDQPPPGTRFLAGELFAGAIDLSATPRSPER